MLTTEGGVMKLNKKEIKFTLILVFILLLPTLLVAFRILISKGNITYSSGFGYKDITYETKIEIKNTIEDRPEINN